MWIRVIVAALFSCAIPLSATDLWRPIGPGDGSPALVAPDPLAPGRLFATWRAGSTPEVYRRDAGADSWSFANRGMEGVEPEALAFHPSRPGTLWAAAQGPLSIFRSTDAGATWQLRFAGRRQDQALGLWSVPNGREPVLLGWFGLSASTAKLSRSRNGGQSWTTLDGARGPVAVLPGTPTAFALGTDGRSLLASRDAGATWTPSGALPADADDEAVLAFLAVSGGRDRRPVLLVSFAESGLFRSIDRGATWSLVGPAGQGPSVVAAPPRTLFAKFASGLYVSVDDGATWRFRAAMSYPAGPLSLAASSIGDLYAVSTTIRELLRSRDGGLTWTRVAPRGVQQFVALDFAWHPLDPRVQVLLSGRLTAAGTVEATEIQWTRNGGVAWRSSPTMRAFAFDPADPRVLYGGTAAGVFVTHDGGSTWTLLRSEPATTLAHSGAALFAGGCGIARSEDGGARWTEVLPCQASASPQLPNGGQLLPSRLVLHPTDPDVLWAEVFESYTLDGHPEGRNALYSSYDGGATWERRDGFGRIALAPGQPDTVWNLGGNLQRSDDRGHTWRVVRYLRSEDTFDLAVDPFDADRIYLVGFFAEVSQDGGATWDFAFDVAKELAPWGFYRQQLTRIFLHPTLPGRIAATPGLGLLLRRERL